MPSQPEHDAPTSPTEPKDGVRLSRALARLPAPLAALILVVAIFGVTWALIVPPWQSPDETTHFAYAQSLATRFALPGDKHRPLGVSSDEALADAAVGASGLAFDVRQDRPNWSARDSARYRAEARQHPSQSDGGGPNAEAANPPLFYLYSDLAYWASGSDNAFGRLYAMRLWGVPLLLTNVVAAWLLAGEVFGRRRPAQFICAAVSGLVPMQTFISVAISPDALMVPLWTVALWLGARVIKRGAQTGDAAWLCAVTAAAILTKATSYALVPAALAALALGWRGRTAAQGRRDGRSLLAALSALIVPVFAWLALSKALGRSAVNTVQTPAGATARPFSIKQFLSYVWQFYLPRPSFLYRFREVGGLPAYSIWLKGGWGFFGWLDVALPAWVYRVLGIVTGVLVLDAAWLISRLPGRSDLRVLGFFGLALVALIFGLHLTDYRSIIAGEGPILQGRYLLPVIGLFGLIVAIVVDRLPSGWRGIAMGAALGALLVLQVLSLATITKTYYT